MEKFLIGELSERAGVTPRTIRYYTAEGLLPEPDSSETRNYYTLEHIERLALIDRLKRRYLPLQEIKHILANASPQDIHQLLQLQDDLTTGLSRPTPAAADPGSAREYIDWLSAQPSWNAEKSPVISRGHHKTRESLTPPPPALPSEAQAWKRIVLAPGIELHFREGLDTKMIQQLNELVRLARQLLTGNSPK